ncbi:MAG: Hsp70 family protein, partial [Pirellulales bacterium]
MTQPQPVGIDLGTTHSAVGYFDAQGRTALLRNAAGELLTPSVVLFDDDEIVVGREALKAARDLPDRVAFGVKRDAGQNCYSRPIRGRLLPTEAIQAAILRQLRQEAVAALGESLSAVITVPAYFDEVRRRATRRAAELAGWQVHDIVNEPTAAALAWCEQARYFEQPAAAAESQRLFVYDLGGGTLDATVIELSAGAVRTLATDGDFRLGGVDWDERLVNHAAEEFLAAYGHDTATTDPRGDEASRMRLFAAAEQAKQTLSQRSSTTLHVEHDGRSLAVPVTRELFERLTEDLLERTAFTSRQTLAAAGCTWSDINHILLVGGSSRMPMVARCLRELSGQEPTLSATCDEDVARGAALFARVRLQEASPATAAEPRDAIPDDAPGVWTPPALPTTPATAGTQQDGGRPTIIDVNSHSLGIQGV